MKKLSIVVAEVWKVSDDPSLTAIVMKMAGFLLPKVVPTIRFCSYFLWFTFLEISSIYILILA